MKKTFIGVLILCILVSNFGIAQAETGDIVIDYAAIEQERIEREARNLILMEKIRELTQMVVLLQEKLDLSRGIDTEVFKDFVALGYENESVRLLQQVLASDPVIYPEGLITGFFGLKTEIALLKFQQTFGLQPTGLFNKETRVILTEVLLKNPFNQTPAPYLKNTNVLNAISEAKSNLALKDLLDNTKVVFSKSPNFSATTKTTDTATLQRILATDPKIYPEGSITGLYSAETAEAVSRFQDRYDLPQTAVVDTATLNTLKSILIENNSSVIQKDLLLIDEVQPKVLLKNNARRILNIIATKEYDIPNVSVSVNYFNGSIDKFLLYPDTANGATDAQDADKADVIDALGDKLERDNAEIEKLLIFNIAEEPNLPKSVLIYVWLNGKISVYFILNENGKYKQIEYREPDNFDWAEKVSFNNKSFTLGEIKTHIIAEAAHNNPVDENIVNAIMTAVADEYRVDVKDLPEIPVSYGVEIFIDNSGGA